VSGFYKNWIFSTVSLNILQNQILWKSI
jgi:hypothetical protein